MKILTKRFFIYFLPISFFVLALIVIFQTKARLAACLGCQTTDYSGEINRDEKVAFYGGKKFPIPYLAFEETLPPVLGVSTNERFIEVDLSEQKLRAWDGSNLFLESLVSTGLPWWPTPKGEFYIWIKLRAAKMEGGEGKYYYYLPNVPYVMYFANDKVPSWRGYGLHGTYWHNDFGRVHSHGCVNLPTEVAEKLYYWTSPILPSGKNIVYADKENPGTKIIIHD